MNILTVTRLMYFMNDKTSFWAPLSLFVGFFYLIQIQTIQRLKDERDNMLQQNQQMQRELVQFIKLLKPHSGPKFYLIIFAFGLCPFFNFLGAIWTFFLNGLGAIWTLAVALMKLQYKAKIVCCVGGLTFEQNVKEFLSSYVGWHILNSQKCKI